MDLEALDSPKHIGEEEAFPKQVEEEEVPPVTEKEAQPNIPEELSPSNIVTEVLGELTPQEEMAYPNLARGKSLTMLQPRSLRETLRRTNLIDEPTEQPT